MKYQYTVINNFGLTSSGQKEAATKKELYQRLAAKGFSILSLEAVKEKRRLSSFGWVSNQEILLFTKNMATMLKGNLNIIDALEITAAQNQGKFKRIITDLINQISSGHSLADSLKLHQRYFRLSYIDIIRTGELAGTLSDNFGQLALQLEKEMSLRRKIKAAMVYPAFIIASTLALGLILATFVLPRLSRLFSSLDLNLPPATRFLLWLTNVMEHYGLIIGAVVVAVIIGLRLVTRVNIVKPIYHRFLLALPFLNTISRQLNLSRFNRTLGSLLQSGLPITEALKATLLALENVVYKQALKQVLAAIEKGSSLAAALERHQSLFPAMMLQLLKAGEESGQLEQTLFYLAGYYEEEVEQKAKNLSVVIEPALLIVIGVVVGFVGLSIITPIYQITSRLGR